MRRLLPGLACRAYAKKKAKLPFFQHLVFFKRSFYRAVWLFNSLSLMFRHVLFYVIVMTANKLMMTMTMNIVNPFSEI